MKHSPSSELISGEDWARADFYALLAQLYSGQFSEDFLYGFKQMESQTIDLSTPLGFEFGELVREAGRRSTESIQAEYDDLFIGIGKPDVFLYGSYYQAGFLNEKPLVQLRDDLAELGLTRDESMTETEDHLAFLCEVMRYLILADDPPVSLDRQREFFQAHIAPWYRRFCDAIEASGREGFFLTVGRLTRVFLDVETQSFDFESAI